MAAIAELKGSRGGTVRGQSPSRDLVYWIRGTDDVAEVEQLVEATSPVSFRGLVRQDYGIDAKGGGNWQATVRYSRQVIHTPKFTFDTGDGTKHLTQSLRTMNRYPAGAPDFQGAIGVDETGVRGVDVPDGVFAFTEKHVYPIAKITPAYVDKLKKLRGKKNKDPWTSTPMQPGGQGYTFAAGEVRFRKATGANVDDDYAEITYHFEASENADNLTVGTLTGIVKRGWDYLWILYQNATSNGVRVKRPAAAYVEEVCEDGDFNSLRFGEVLAIVVTDGGAGYLAAPAVTIAPPTGPGGTQATATAVLYGGEVVDVVVTAGGSGYETPPQVTIAPPPVGTAGSPAGGTAIIG